MADTRDLYRGWEPRQYGPFRRGPQHANHWYWWMGGKSWFPYLRKDGTKRVRFVFDYPMSQSKRRRAA